MPHEALSEGKRLVAGPGADNLNCRSPCIFRYLKTSIEIIHLVVILHVRYSLSLWNVAGLLRDRGIGITHETGRLWWNQFGKIFAADPR